MAEEESSSRQYVVDDLPPTIKERADLCKTLATELRGSFPDDERPLNVNIAKLQDGIIVSVHKGTADELNNAIFQNFDLHPALQQCEKNPVWKRVERDVKTKMTRCARSVLGMFTRVAEHRAMIKARINSAKLSDRIDALQQLNLADQFDFSPKGCQSPTEIWKLVAFQLAQSVALAELGVEVFSKEAVCDLFPDLTPFLRRESEGCDRQCLEDLKGRFIACASKFSESE